MSGLDRLARLYLSGLIGALPGAALLVALVWLLTRLLGRRLSPSVHCWLWWLVCARLVLVGLGGASLPLPLLSPMPVPLTAPLALATSPLPTLSARAVAPSMSPEASRQPAPVFTLWSGLGLAYGAWVLLGLWLLARQLWQLRRLLAAARPLDDTPLGGIVRQEAVRFRLAQPPRLRESPEVTSPLVAGFLRPMLVLPAGFAQTTDDDEAGMALAHELAHLRRGDLYLALVPGLARLLLFPLVPLWLPVCRAWASAREAACDAEALSHTGGSPTRYSRLLLKLVSGDEKPSPFSALGATSAFHGLQERIDSVLKPARASKLAALLVLAVVGSLMLPWRLTQRTPDAPTTTPSEQKETKMKTGPVLLATLALSGPAFAQQPDWPQRFAGTKENWRKALALGYELTELPGDAGLNVLKAQWKNAPIESRQQIQKAFVFSHHPRALAILNLGATDPSPEAQGWAFTYLKTYALIDFAEDYSRYASWWSKYGTKNDLVGAQKDGLEEVLMKLKTAPKEKREALVAMVSDAVHDAFERKEDSLKTRLAQPDVKRLAETWIAEENARGSSDYGLVEVIPSDETWLRAKIAPLLQSPREELISLAARTLGKKSNPWAYPLLEESFRQRTVLGKSAVLHTAEALAEIGEAKAIPLMIGGVLASEKLSGPAGGDGRYWVGYFGLEKLTGVSWNEAHDGAWWKAWWEKNKARFGPEIAALEIPNLKKP